MYKGTSDVKKRVKLWGVPERKGLFGPNPAAQSLELEESAQYFTFPLGPGAFPCSRSRGSQATSER